MRFMHDIEPFLGPAFPFADKAPDTVYQDFGACARQRIHARFFKFQQHITMTHFFELANMRHFRRPQSMQF